MKKKDNSFFEEDNDGSSSPAQIKNAVKTTKDTPTLSGTGEYYRKNVLYKYKDGTTCRVVYDAKDANFVIRETS